MRAPRSALSILAIGLLSASSAAQAISLSFDPPSHDVPVGSPVAVNLVISGLADAAAPSLGSFDLDLVYDPLLLVLTGVAFGDPVLGDQLDLAGFGSISGFDGSLAGTLNLFEISIDLVTDLDALQAGSFTLATLSFDALAAGTSFLEIASASLKLGDSLGDPLSSDLTPGSITVIPEPAAVTLTLIGILLLALVRRLRLGTAQRRTVA